MNKIYGATDSGYAIIGEMDVTATVDMPETKTVPKKTEPKPKSKSKKKEKDVKEEKASECDDSKSTAKKKRKVASEGFLNDTEHVPDEGDKDLAKKKKATITTTPKKGSK